ncbi:MAG: DUF4190 domain-containing protein [Ilumatobacteraceae bacterium]
MSDAPPPNWGGPPPPPQQPSGSGPYPANYGQQPPPPPYGYQQYGGGGMMPANHPQGTTILVLGILSLVVCSILGPFAWSMGNKAIREIDADGTTIYANRGQIVAGRICGMIATILLAISLVVVVIAIIAAAASSN